MERLRGLPGVCDRGVGPALVEACRVVHTFKNKKKNMEKDNNEREREVINKKEEIAIKIDI